MQLMKLKQYQICKSGADVVFVQVLVDSAILSCGILLLIKTDLSFLKEMLENGWSYQSIPVTIWGGLSFLAVGVLFFFIALYSIFGVETWYIHDGVLYREARLFCVAFKKQEWLLSDIEAPILTRIVCDVNEASGGSFDSQRLPGSKNNITSAWIVCATFKPKRRTVRLYCSCTKKCADEFFMFLKKVKSDDALSRNFDSEWYSKYDCY